MKRRSLMVGAGLGAAHAGFQSAFAAGPAGIVIERPQSGTPHKGKVLAAIQAHSDDIPLVCGGTVAKLVREGYTGYLIRATNDDMGDEPGLGTAGTIGENVLGNERDNDAVARALGMKGVFNLNYSNHKMSPVLEPEVIGRLIFIFRFLQVDTVVSWDPWGHYEENPDHAVIARCVESACWMAGRPHDFPEHLAAGLKLKTIQERYFYARYPDLQAVNRVVDVSRDIDALVESNRANVAKGPAGRKGSELRAALAARGQKLPLLEGGDDAAADRAYIREFVLGSVRATGRRYGLAYAESFRHFGRLGDRPSSLDDYVKKNARPR